MARPHPRRPWRCLGSATATRRDGTDELVTTSISVLFVPSGQSATHGLQRLARDVNGSIQVGVGVRERKIQFATRRTVHPAADQLVTKRDSQLLVSLQCVAMIP